VAGYSVELVAYDDGADVEMAMLQARKLALDPEVVAVVGHFREETTAAASSFYAEAGLALIAAGTLDGGLEANGGLVLLPAPDVRDLAVALLDGLPMTALVGADLPLGTALQDAAAEMNIPLAPVVSPDDAAWLENLLDADPPAVICVSVPLTAGSVVSALRSAGWRGEFLGGPELAAGDFYAVAGSAAEGAEFITPWPLPEDVEGRPDFAAAYVEVSGGPPPGPLALPAYDAAWVVLRALERAIEADGEPSRAGVALALQEDTLGDGLYRYRIDVGGALELVGER
jgi:ABC-type branched-subunit amino acid transport system substrate-binding protein